MKKILLILAINLIIQSLIAQEIKISHKDVTYFNDTISYELKDQLPNGTYKVYYDSLKTILDCSGEISDQKRVNNWTWYYESGSNKRETSYQNGALNGQDSYYYTNGQQSVMTNYTMGIQNGSSTGWYTNGIKMFEGIYQNGAPSGTWKFYNEDGTIFREEQHN